MRTRKKQPRKHGPEVVSNVVNLYEEGMSLREIAQRLGISYGSANTFCKEAGVMRPRGFVFKKTDPLL
jgi:transposase-like protein